MKGKKVSESSVVLAHLMSARDLNLFGVVYGGFLMSLIDNAAYVVATRHSRAKAVTASVDRLVFHNHVYAGELITLKASINLVSKTSMEIGVRVDSENLMTGKIKHAASAYITYSALDKYGKPKTIPPLILETEDEKRRNLDAQARKEIRLRERQKQEKNP